MSNRKVFSAVIPVESEDKKGYDKTPPSDHPCSMPRRSRICYCSPPGHGKTANIKNCLIHSRSDRDPWAHVVVITGVGDFCKEWDKVQHTKTDFTTADEKWWAALSKKHDGKPIACIVDDLNYADLSPKERSNAYKLYQFVCTHMNVTTFCATHSWVQLIPRLRRACDIIVMWAPTSGGSDQLNYISRSLGIPKPVLQEAFSHCQTKYENIVIYTDPPAGRSKIMINYSEPFYDE
jgi:hypothetical protein